MEQRTEYVVPIEVFKYTNSIGVDFEMETKLYITKHGGIGSSNELHWDVWVGADDYGHRECLSGYLEKETLENVIEMAKNEYYIYHNFQDYVLDTE